MNDVNISIRKWWIRYIYFKFNDDPIIGMFVEPEKELVLAESTHWAISWIHQWQLVIDGDGQVLKRLLASPLRDPETQFGNSRFKAALVAIQSLLQLRHETRRRIILYDSTLSTSLTQNDLIDRDIPEECGPGSCQCGCRQ